MFINCSETKTDQLYRLLIGSVVPRPIAWVSSVNDAGINNLAPFSFFNIFSVKPPMLGFAPGYKRPEAGSSLPVAKDTLVNVRAGGEFVVNVVSQSLVEQMNQSSGEFENDISEFAVTGLTPQASTMIKPPRIAEALISMECKVFHIHELGGSALVLGEILCLHYADGVIGTDGLVDLNVLQPIGRLGGISYSTVKDRFDIERPIH